MNLTDIKDIWLALPPKSEQKAIESYLRTAIATVEPMEDKTNQAISRLQEYRTALITNAVTGKIDVRDVMLELKPVEAA
ncbi:MAG: hypothetical protein RBJ76_15615 [Stenomitos frigidus ULC029]